MKSFSLTLVTVVLSFLSLSAQSFKTQVLLYGNSGDVYYKNPGTPAIAVIKDSSARHLRVKKFTNLQGGKLKRSVFTWAIDYNDRMYFNLGYSTDLNNWMVFVPFDIQGKYAVIFIDENSPAIVRRGGSNYAMGLAGVLANESTKWGKAWIDREGKKRRFLFIDTDDIQDSLTGNTASHGNYLTRNQLKELCAKNGIELPEMKIKDLPFEEVVELIHTMNRKAQKDYPVN